MEKDNVNVCLKVRQIVFSPFYLLSVQSLACPFVFIGILYNYPLATHNYANNKVALYAAYNVSFVSLFYTNSYTIFGRMAGLNNYFYVLWTNQAVRRNNNHPASLYALSDLPFNNNYECRLTERYRRHGRGLFQAVFTQRVVVYDAQYTVSYSTVVQNAYLHFKLTEYVNHIVQAIDKISYVSLVPFNYFLFSIQTNSF